MSVSPWPDRLLTLEDWDALPEDKSHRYELVEGLLLVAPQPAPIHQRVAQRLAVYLDVHTPDEVTAFSDVDVLIDPVPPITMRAPDVVLVPTLPEDQYPTRFDADDLLLAVEIVSPGTGRIDRVTKPGEYAEAGIPHYWLIELDAPATMTAFTLVDGYYEHVAGGTGKVEVVSPFPVTIDLDALISNSGAGKRVP